MNASQMEPCGSFAGRHLRMDHSPPMRSDTRRKAPKPPAAANFALVVVAAIIFSANWGCDSNRPTPRDRSDDARVRVKLGLNWFPEAEHGGYYAALVHGFFADEGLDVEIVRGGPESPIVQQVAGGERDFGVANADNLLFARAQQAPVVALMAPIQRSPRCIMVHESSGIRDFADLKEMTLGLSVTQAFSHYLRKKAPLTGVKIVPTPPNVAQFLEDPRFGQQGYVFSEPFVARKRGSDPYVLMLADLGFNPYTSLLFAADGAVRDRADICRKMVRASIRGWQKYLADPAATNARIHELNPEMDLDILAFGAEQIASLIRAPGDETPIGSMTLDRWRQLGEQLVEAEQLKSEQIDSRGAFTLEFLDVALRDEATAPNNPVSRDPSSATSSSSR